MVRLPVRHGPTLQRWSFASWPRQWSFFGRARRSGGDGVDVVTNRQSNDYQAVSPAVELDPGTYGVIVRGAVRSGGFALQVLDVKKQQFVVANYYSADQRRSSTNFDNATMFAKFSLASNAKIQLVLANFSPGRTASRWRLQSVSLVRQPRPCGCSPRDSNAWISR